jgi:hypothetical protein
MERSAAEFSCVAKNRKVLGANFISEVVLKPFTRMGRRPSSGKNIFFQRVSMCCQ